MLGKIAGAMLGRKLASRNNGMSGAMLGYGAAALARRGLGPLAAGAAVLWGVNKFRNRRGSAAYPSDATPTRP